MALSDGTRLVAALTLAVASARPLRADDPPLLLPPAGASVEPPGDAATGPKPIPNEPNRPSPRPATPATARPAVPAPAERRPVLALPGLTMPATRPVRPERRPDVSELPPSLSPAADGGLPPATRPPEPPTARFRGRVIESEPIGETNPMPSIAVPTRPIPMPRAAAPVPAPAGRIPIEGIDGPTGPAKPKAVDPKGEKSESAEKKAPTRRSTILGGRVPSPFGPRAIPNPGANASTIRAEPRSDPAADAALKARVEKQARAVVGDRARELDVRVVGRSVTIHALGVRLLQQWSVRKNLESLPGLAGYRATIHVDD